jgi:hypothetical protein
MTTTRRLAGILAALAVVSIVAACSSSASSSVAPSDAGAAPISPSAAPSDGDVPVKGPDQPIGNEPPHVEPGPGGATFVTPQPGQLDIHPVRMDGISASADGRNVVVTATWTSGVEPCNTLDTILVERGDHAITITLREGHGPRDVACIDLAQLKGTRIDLGDLDPGTWLISDGGGDVSTQVVVS